MQTTTETLAANAAPPAVDDPVDLLPTSFTDAAGREWHFAITIDKARAAREWGVDLMTLVQPDALRELVNDPIRLVDLWWLLLADQGQRHKVDDYQFGGGLDGDSLDTGIDAFIGALIRFFPRRQRGPLAALWQRIKGLEDKQAARALKMIASEKVDQALATELDAAESQLEERLNSGGPFSSSPA